MTYRTNAVAKTRAHQVRWSSWCRSRTAGAGAVAGAGGAAAAGRTGRATEVSDLPGGAAGASNLVHSTPQLQPDNHALLRPQKSESKLNDYHE